MLLGLLGVGDGRDEGMLTIKMALKGVLCHNQRRRKGRIRATYDEAWCADLVMEAAQFCAETPTPKKLLESSSSSIS